MVQKIVDLIGNRYGKLVVMSFYGLDKNNNKLWECLCDCGNFKSAYGHNLVRGECSSCGCSIFKPEDFYGSVFGDLGQLCVVGHTRNPSGGLLFKLDCGVCELDPELFKPSGFETSKYKLENGFIPCNCGVKYNWTKDQYILRIERKCKELGFSYLGYKDTWDWSKTKISLFCSTHGEWDTCTVSSFLSSKRGCPSCAKESPSIRPLKPDNYFKDLFFNTGSFPPGTTFRRTSENQRWEVCCGICKEITLSYVSNLKIGTKACSCGNQKPIYVYINTIKDNDKIVALKFGVTSNPQVRILSQRVKSVYTVDHLLCYKFKSTTECRDAERLVKGSFVCGILPKAEFKDGYTETTSTKNLDDIITILKNSGGVNIELV